MGGGISEKGWVEEGSGCYCDIAMEPEVPTTFKDKVSLLYINLQVGLSYDLVIHKKFTLSLGQLITSEYGQSGNPEFFRAIVVSTRTNLSLQYSISKKIGLQLTPFFQTALERYNKKVSNPLSSNWTPYGYGATVGIMW